MRNIKLIWDFRGPAAKRTAEHHLIHLREFSAKEGLSTPITGIEELHESHFMAFMVVPEDRMPEIRDALRPHRGVFFKEE